MSHMTHSHQCSDGKFRTIHWSKDAKIGDTWTCRRCGGSSVLASKGQPAVIKASKKPPIQQPTGATGGSGCLFLLASISISALGAIALITILLFN
jgi:hypothetical protein